MGKRVDPETGGNFVCLFVCLLNIFYITFHFKLKIKKDYTHVNNASRLA